VAFVPVAADYCQGLLMRALTRTLTAVSFVSLSGLVHAVTPVDSVGTQVIIPAVASTTAYQTQVFVFNPNNATLNVTIDYIGGSTWPAAPLSGITPCTGAAILPSRTAVIDPAVQCALTGNQFGTLRISENSAANLPFTAYSRTQTPTAIGFSIEGVPVGNFSLDHIVSGLKSGGSPLYKTNCFVGTFGDAVDYEIQLTDGTTGFSLGGLITGTLPANSLLRILDIFAAAGLAPGIYTNVNAYINENTTTEPAIIAFCTVENNSNGSADYRIGKSPNPFDSSRDRDSTTYRSRLDENFTVNAGSQSNLHEIYFRAPDRVACALVDTPPILGGNPPGDAAKLELRLLDQSASLADAQAAGGNGHVLAGGDNQSSFNEVFLGWRGTATATSFDGLGVNGRSLIQVEGKAATGPAIYGIRCTSGNGHTRPALIKTLGVDVF